MRRVQRMDAVGQLTGGVAHDFNNLLAVIVGNLDLLEQDLADRPAAKDLVARALDAAERGASLTRRLLAFARKQTLQPRATPVGRLIEDMAKLLAPTIGETITLETRLADGLAPSLVDPGQLETAILNLVLNARDAMGAGGRITIEAANVTVAADYTAVDPEAAPGDHTMVAVTDTGGGMTPDVRRRALEPFFTTKEVGKGSGLGLSMVDGFIRQSGGHVRIESEPGRGTTVRLYLPSTTAEHMDAGRPESGRVERGDGRVVLVVEDNEQMRQFSVTAIAGLGYAPLAAADADQALRPIERDPLIQVLFTDIIMPGTMDGFALARRALALRPDLKVLFTTGFADTGSFSRDGLPADAAIVRKPFRKSELGHHLAAVLAARAA
ncbi:MAG: response regulator [Alphaproteobacteria bacterium]|nr:response regulator [Alphaproteobacteria bacterium]